MYTLYHHPYSQHARRVVPLLEEAKLPYELRNIGMEQGEYLLPAYLAINPNHQIPTLFDGDLKIHESNAILRYLCLKHDLKEWYPDNLPTRAAVEQWLDWNQCRLAPAVVDIVFNMVFLGEDGDKTAIARGEQILTELAAILDTKLTTHSFLTGDKPTIADLSVGSNIFQLSLADAIPKQPSIQRWFGRLCEIEGFQKSLPQQ